ncbi:MAG: hypothetical protein IJX77_02900 [Ruminococcus sp.]|nr:hypothetical protein [Ruminococcus sp.]
MKKFLIAAAAAVCVCFAGCESRSSASLTYKVETGDSIKVTLDTKDNDYSLKSEDNTFIVKEEDEIILQGIFLTMDSYYDYETVIWETGINIDSEDDYIFYQYNGDAGMESNFLIQVPDSDTGVIIASLEDADDAMEAFEKLKFENVKD